MPQLTQTCPRLQAREMSGRSVLKVYRHRKKALESSLKWHKPYQGSICHIGLGHDVPQPQGISNMVPIFVEHTLKNEEVRKSP